MVDQQHGEMPAQSQASAQAGGARSAGDLAQDVGVKAQPASVQGPSKRGARILPAFDGEHPPEPHLIDDCVHCGFCLPSCPTYLLWGEEMDSPRGRIYLMRAAHDGEPMNDVMVRHWDACLGCLACVTACPSGVQYGTLIESTRQQVERRYPRSRADRLYRSMLFALLPYHRRLALAALPLKLYHRGLRQALIRYGVLQRMPARIRGMDEILPEPPPRERISEWTPAQGIERMRVGLLLGCVQRVFFPQVNAATTRVMAADGCSVGAPRAQGCCGALSAHTGREQEAMRLARKTITVFERLRVEKVAVNVAGCGSHMKSYGHLLRDDPQFAERARQFSARVCDASELLAEIGPRATRHPLAVSVVYHDACHLAHGQGIRAEPRAELQAIPDLEVREVPLEREICCGSAGTYNLLEPEPARELGERKARAVLQAGAQLLVTSNPGCHLQITAAARRLGSHIPAAHIMQVLDASIRQQDPETLL